MFVYSLLYGLTAKESRWLGAITSAAVIILGKALMGYIIINIKHFYIGIPSLSNMSEMPWDLLVSLVYFTCVIHWTAMILIIVRLEHGGMLVWVSAA